MTLTTKYLGLTLSHPIVCGASPLTANLDTVLRLEDAGAAAIVMHSLFEEQILRGAMRRTHLSRDSHQDSGGGAVSSIDAYARLPEQYLEHLLRVKSRVRIPVMASLNGTTAEGWLQYARAFEHADADAIELNFYNVAADPAETGAAIEQRLIDIVTVVKESARIPVAVKLAPSFTSIANVAARLERIGADGLVLFNRLYLSDIDADNGHPLPQVSLSDSSELPPRLHAVATVARFTGMSVCLSGGVHDGLDVAKGLMAGADAVQVASALMRHGPRRLTQLRLQLAGWLERHGYESVSQVKSTAAIARERRLPSTERDDYLSVLKSWHPAPMNH